MENAKDVLVTRLNKWRHNMLRLRFLTAIILIPFVIWGIFILSQPAFILVAAFVILLGAWEWATLFGWVKPLWRLLYCSIIFLSMILSLLSPPWITIAIASIWWTIAAIWIIVVERQKKITPVSKYLVAITGILVLVPCWQALIVLHLNPKWLLMLLIIVWVADTSAYFGGRWLGHHKLAPTISPNKTLEGVYTALIVGAIIIIGGQWLIFHSVEPTQITSYLGLVLSTTIAAVIGDLFESFLKRQQGLKDSGRLLPGHGGVLDRIDSLTAAAPIFICSALFFRLL